MIHYTFKQIAMNWRLWQEYVDPHGVMSKEEFDDMSIAQRIALQEATFGEPLRRQSAA